MSYLNMLIVKQNIKLLHLYIKIDLRFKQKHREKNPKSSKQKTNSWLLLQP